jgi:hypothetical protein
MIIDNNSMSVKEEKYHEKIIEQNVLQGQDSLCGH